MAVRAADKITLAVVKSPSYVRQYYVLQASALSAPALPTTNPPASPWSTTEPAYTSGSTNTLYTVMLTAYGSATFEYGPVQVSSSFEAAKQAYNLASGAVTAANTAVTTANGKNKTIFSTSDASGTTGYIAGDIWYKKSGNVIVAQWEFVSGAWAARTIDSAVLGNLDAGKITTGTLNADRIGADTLVGKTITGGTVVGATIKSSESGQRVEISATDESFYAENGALAGRISGRLSLNSPSIELESGTAWVQIGGNIEQSEYAMFTTPSIWTTTLNGSPVPKLASGSALAANSNIAVGTGQNIDVTFPAGRFSSAPVVTANAHSSRLTASVNIASVTKDGCTIRIDNWSNATAFVPNGVSWIAVLA